MRFGSTTLWRARAFLIRLLAGILPIPGLLGFLSTNGTCGWTTFSQADGLAGRSVATML